MCPSWLRSKIAMFVMTKKSSIIIKSNNMLHVSSVGAHVDLFMLINTMNMTRINHKIWHTWL